MALRLIASSQSIDHELWNELFAELDRKVTAVMDGKTWLLARDPAVFGFMGMIFRFGYGGPQSGWWFPDVPYVHSRFTDFADEADLTLFDAERKIALMIQPADAATADSIGLGSGELFLDHSLEAHRRSFIAPSKKVRTTTPGSLIQPLPAMFGDFAFGETAFGDGDSIDTAPAPDLGSVITPLPAMFGDFAFGESGFADGDAFAAAAAAPAAPELRVAERGEPYWLLEPHGPGFNLRLVPQKIYRFALAELILEGPDLQSFAFDARWNKFNCFRVHNCNGYDLTIDFDGQYQFEVPRYGCRTVRRIPLGSDVPPTEYLYEPGYNYFFKFRAGDPRLYSMPHDPGSPWGSQGANNITSPALVTHRVLKAFSARSGLGGIGQRYPGPKWNLDPHVLNDVADLHAGYFPAAKG